MYTYVNIFPIRIYLPTYPKMFNGFKEPILFDDLVCWIGLGDRLYFLGGMSQSVCSIPNAKHWPQQPLQFCAPIVSV